jgi:hypothetical protein
MRSFKRDFLNATSNRPSATPASAAQQDHLDAIAQSHPAAQRVALDHAEVSDERLRNGKNGQHWDSKAQRLDSEFGEVLFPLPSSVAKQRIIGFCVRGAKNTPSDNVNRKISKQRQGFYLFDALK